MMSVTEDSSTATRTLYLPRSGQIRNWKFSLIETHFRLISENVSTLNNIEEISKILNLDVNGTLYFLHVN